ncbi:MAG: LysR family transcriptional regulator [[Actinobacillus] rossii]|nr:LysR family transcriptional regulator [[Actinobacillus] rossii]MDY5792980.1 LysR family transcriptional regulator [[Actinobacillus] rossii]
MRLTLKQLSVFITVYRFGKTTQAGEELSLSQPAISSALSELEKLLEIQLFERNGKKLIATKAADKLYPQAMSLISQAKAIEKIFLIEKVQLHIGASTTVGNYLLPKLISDFMKANSHIEIILHVHNTKEICEGVRNFNYDAGFIEGDNLFDELIAEAWQQDELMLFCSANTRFLQTKQNKITLEHLQKLPLVLREQGSGTRETIERLILFKLSNYNAMQLYHSEAIRQAVIHDFGIGCLSKYVLDDAYELGKIRYLSLTGHKLMRTLWLITHHNKHISEPLAQFLEFCRKNK